MYRIASGKNIVLKRKKMYTTLELLYKGVYQKRTIDAG